MRFLITLMLAGTVLAADDDWPQFLGPHRDGSYQGKALPIWPDEGPKQLWQNTIGSGYAGPAVSGGKVILFHRIDQEEIVECLEAASGNLLWQAKYPADYVDAFRFDNGPRAVPAIADGRVYTHGAHGVVRSWDFKTGKAIWQLDARTQYRADKGFFGFACSPLVTANTVLLNIGGPRAGIIELDTASGKLRWRATEEPASYASPVLATINAKPQAVFFTREGLVSVDPATGKVHFSHHWRPAMHASVNACTPVVSGNRVFASTSYGKGATMLAVNDGKLETVWANDTSLSCHYSSCVVKDGYLYGFHGRQEAGADLRCVEFKTGRVLWSQPGLRSGTVTLAGDDLLVLTERGELVRAEASPKAFRIKQRARVTRGEVRAFPALANGRFYFRDGDKLVCLQLGE